MVRHKLPLLCTIFIALFIYVNISKTSEYRELNPVDSTEYRVRDITNCQDKYPHLQVDQRGNFFVLYNFVKAEKHFSCHESITYTTQGDYTFFDNIPQLIAVWNGPVSVACYAPGDDFERTLKSIAYLRNCETQLIRSLVTFHIYFDGNHFPKNLNTSVVQAYNDHYDCTKTPPFLHYSKDSSYRKQFNLTYPINVARNVARLSATTHFVFASDIELYPTPGFIPKFLKMIADHPAYERRSSPAVYALPIYEIVENVGIPKNKTALQIMLRTKEALLFHKKLCSICHRVPGADEWEALNETDGLSIYTVSKRQGKQFVWEAFYIGTNVDPIFDERLTWEGQSNKMSQGYAMCLLDYDYMVLDNAFLIHKPGIKKSKEQLKKYQKLVSMTNAFRSGTLKPQLKLLYGNRPGCSL